MAIIFIRWIDRQHWIETISYKVILAWKELFFIAAIFECTLFFLYSKIGAKTLKNEDVFKEKII